MSISTLKKYSSILRYGKKETIDAITDTIIIWEKLDGANASFTIHESELFISSRRFKVTAEETLNGFYGYVLGNVKEELLNPNYIYFGEWLTPHKIKYKEEHSKKFYLFDVYDKTTETYLNIDVIRAEAVRLNLLLAPILYEGPFVSIEHIESFVGKSVLSIDGEGEGIVIKSYEYKDKYGCQLFVKMVTDKFKEVKAKKIKTNTNSEDVLTLFVDNVVTVNRVEKIMQKLMDEGTLKDELDMSDMGIILKALGNQVVEDVIKEEFDEIQKILNKKIAKKVPNVVKEILKKDE